MPSNQLIDSTYYIFDSSATALPWPQGARIQQIRLFTVNTSASVEFQVVSGTPWFLWNYITHGAVSAGSATAVVPAYHTIQMGGVRVTAGLIPATLSSCTAWIDFI